MKKACHLASLFHNYLLSKKSVRIAKVRAIHELEFVLIRGLERLLD